MKVLIFSVLLVGLHANFTSKHHKALDLKHAPKQQNSTVAGVSKSLIFLGQSSDGKAMFLGNSTSLTWQEGRELCESLDLRLLSIRSQQQHDFALSKIINIGTGYYEYWTSAREHRYVEGFTWDDGEKEYPKFMKDWGYYSEDSFPYKLCATLVKHEGNVWDGAMFSRQCTDKRFVLCEAYSH